MSYYKQIEGIRYDRAILVAAQEAVSGRGDGRVSRDDAEKLLTLVTDGGRYTAVEAATVTWMKDNLTWTDKARAWFDQALQQRQDAPTPPTATLESASPASGTPAGSRGPVLLFRIAPGNRFSRFCDSSSSVQAEGCAVVLLPTNDGPVSLEPIWKRTHPHEAADFPGERESDLCAGVLSFARQHISSVYRLFGADLDGYIHYKVGFTNVPAAVLIRALHAEGFCVLDAEVHL